MTSRKLSMLFAVDLVVALACLAICFIIFPEQVALTFAKEIYNLGATVFSVIFSVYLAALAIVIAGTDEDFIRFLEEGALFSDLLWGLEWTLFVLFFAVAHSCASFIWCTWQDSHQAVSHPSWLMALFAFTFVYAFGATLSSTRMSIRYAKMHADYLQATRKQSAD